MANEFGGFAQAVFFGASVTNFSANVGWNEQTTSLNVTLVEDESNGDVFQKPNPGTPCSFSFVDFRFDGIVQSWEEKKSFQGYPIYEITINDPRELLNGVQIILGGYNGSTGGMANLFNPYGYLESLSFGAAQQNEAGMPLIQIASAMQVMTNGISTAYGGPFIYFNGHAFTFDFSSLPAVPNFYRMSGDSITLMDLISTVCQDSANDFIVNMTYGSEYSTIYLKLRSTAEQPDLNYIQSYIDSKEYATQKSRGLELRNEVTSVFVVGGEQEQVFQVNYNGSYGSAASIWPYWGLDNDGNVIVGTGIDDEHQFTVDTSKLNIPNLGDSYTITVGEIRAALKDQSSWMFYIQLTDEEKANSLNISSKFNINQVRYAFSELVSTVETRNTQKKHAKNMSSVFGSDTMKNLNSLYEFVRGYAQEYYGKKYMVRVPSVMVKQESETFRVVLSHEPSDSGFLSAADWGDGNRPLNLPAIYEDIFTDSNGKYNSFVGYDFASTYDLTKLSNDSTALDSDKLFVKCDIDQNYVYLDAASYYSPRVVLTLSGPVNELTEDGKIPYFQEGLKQVLDAFSTVEGDAKEKLEKLGKNAAGGFPLFPMGPSTNMPKSACIPLRSNIATYGPWYNAGAQGKVRFEKNSSLVPWNFGGYAYMNYAGAAAVTSAISNMMIGEMGSIDIAGTPDISIGDELIAGGPNVTGIDVTVGTQGITTSYRLRSYTPTFGQFSKQNADRFQRMSRGANDIRREALRKIKAKYGTQLEFAQRAFLAQGESPPNMQTPHEAIIAKIVEKPVGESTVYKTICTIGTVQELLPGLNADDSEEYKYTGFCTLDNLFKPFSTNHTLDPKDVDNITRIQEPRIYNKKCVTSWSYFPFGEPNDGIAEAEDSSKGGGIDSTFLANQTQYPDVGLNPNQDDFDNTDARGIALAGPLIISGWGLDIFGRPIPGYYEDDDNIPTDLSDGSDDMWDKYINNYRLRPDLWKTGPVDLVWCQIRNVWTSNPMYIGKYRRTGKVRIDTGNDDYVEVAIEDRLNNAAILADDTPVIIASIMGKFVIVSVGCVGI